MSFGPEDFAYRFHSMYLLKTVCDDVGVADVDASVVAMPAPPWVVGATAGAHGLIARRTHGLELGVGSVFDCVLREVVAPARARARLQRVAQAGLVSERQPTGDVSDVADGVNVDVGLGERISLDAKALVEVPGTVIVLGILRWATTSVGELEWLHRPRLSTMAQR